MTNKFFILLITLGIFSSIYSQTINIHSITTSRQSNGDKGYTLDGIRMAGGSRLKLTNTNNFGSTGTYPKNISIFDGYGTSGSLTGASAIPTNNIFFFGFFNKLDASTQQFTNEEIDSLFNWSTRGGKLIIGVGIDASIVGYDGNILNSKWGYTYQLQSPSNFIPTTIGSSSYVFNGPFGNVIAANQGAGAQGYFSQTPTNSSILATDNNGNPTLIMDCNTLDLIIADVDGYTDLGGVTSGGTINNNQDKFWANTIVFMDKLQPSPVLLNNSGILSLNASYNDYQWYYDGNPISNDSVLQTSNCGEYYSEVTLNGGCKIFSDTISINNSTSVLNESVCNSYISPSENYVWTENGTYADTIQNIFGCDSIIIINLTINNCDTLFEIPNVFTPNKDGQNDLFKPLINEKVKSLKMKIYNRWGQLIYESNQKNEGWNGTTTSGIAVSEGTYFYIINAEIIENGNPTDNIYKGTLTLIR
ncbi:MAG: gliding motility-associated C-terminal domain-containing protein [Flavobacteriales bacterium]|nr:gliding motility-associated C-terminal domain-containing protein [Flavobacteriales bacterium]MCB9364154.1 gliding motility-associated C-terminal domain-containing protein [Flavobacteriales bacterium]